VESTPEQAVIKVNCETLEDVARNPLVWNYAYITLTAQKTPNTHNMYKWVMTMTNRDMTTWSFFRWYGWCTCIGEATEMMKKQVLDFLEKHKDNKTIIR
jgi:hypothetical protein